ncbi:ATP-binding SpoIIE family protein phosphatase [Streptomyces sp. NBC_00271]|uniref:ATP-binding SpoIIE family protein phosphatase n=1 Tax=Streptomyces sp. NBC_00271 TaxID=2975697 RepID=UPI002E2B7757|nr:SpoIIE family protein phosphatase [Streptomyces sp. NBC_00271]
MDFTPNSLVSHVAYEFRLDADQLIDDVKRCLRREVPELWEDPDITNLTLANVADHVTALLFGLERGIEPSEVEMPPAELERARWLARRGKPMSLMLRGLRLGQSVMLDRLLERMSRLTGDVELISAATRKLIDKTTRYADRVSEQRVVVFQEERDRRVQWRLSMVNEASKRIGTTLDIARTTQELADLATEHFADLVTVDLLDSAFRGQDTSAPDPPVMRRVARQSVRDCCPESTIQPQQLHTYPDGSPHAYALATGHPSLHPFDVPASDWPAAAPDRSLATNAHGIHSTLVVPLCARGATLGVVQFFRRRNPDPFDDEDLLLAQEMTARAAVAVDNARRYTHARATALALQRSLLPRHAPQQSAMEVASRYLPAGGQVGVGGDWYDIIPLSGARVALVVGDVVGHGIPAAATMGRLRAAVRTLADIDLPPDELLTHLDDVVIRLSGEASTDPDIEADGDVGATCLYAVYDPVSRRCTLARAGHVLPVLVRQDGTVDVLDLPPGPPLGLGGLPFEAAEFDLPEGSILALYTDGLIEARDHDIDEGLTALSQALAQSPPSLEATCDTVLEALLPARPDDDVALLLARPRAFGADQVATWDLDADPAAVSLTRSRVSKQLSTWGLEQLGFSTELVVSELVTNAIRYGRPPIRLRLIRDRALLCEVSDASSTTPHLRRARVFDEGGRGLFLVAQLAEHWGTRHARRGKTVWAELNDSGGSLAQAFL